MSQSIRARAAFLVFRSTLKNHNVEICLPVKFRLIPFSGFRGVVQISQPIRGRRAIFVFRSARQRQTSLRTLRSCFRSSFFKFRSAVSEEKSRIAPPIRGLTAILVFRLARKKTPQTWWRTLRSSFLSSVIEFHSGVLEEKSKMRKPYDEGRMPGRRTDYRQHMITKVNLSLWLRCT